MKGVGVRAFPALGADKVDVGVLALVNLPPALGARQAVTLVDQILGQQFLQTFRAWQRWHDFPPSCVALNHFLKHLLHYSTGGLLLSNPGRQSAQNIRA